MEITVELDPDPEKGPRALFLDGRRKEVVEVLDRWPGRDHLYLKVRCDDGGIYVLRREEATGGWELHLFDGGAGPPLSGE